MAPLPITALDRDEVTIVPSLGRKVTIPELLSPTRFLEIVDNPFYRVLCQLQDVVYHSTVDFWRAQNVWNIFLPITTGSISSPMGLGSDSLPVHATIDGSETYLADSMQFLLEYGCRLHERGTYYMMPSFRGEQADATHLSQFFHSEAEVVGSLDVVIQYVENYLVHLTRDLITECGNELERLGIGLQHLNALAETGGVIFERLTFDEAVGLLNDNDEFIQHHEEGWRTITRAGELELIRRVSPFTWVTHWDHLAVPFYQRMLDGEVPKAANADLLFGPGEVVGAGERHVSGNDVRDALQFHKVVESDYDWYVAMKDAYPMRTSGFGLGIERFFMWALQHNDIRDLQLVPRLKGHVLQP